MIKGDNILNVGTPAGGGISIIANDPVTSGGGGKTICGWSVYTPFTDISSLEFHIQADHDVFTDAGLTCADDTQAIQQVNSLDDIQINAIQTVVAEKPTYAVASLNGTNTIDFAEDTLDLSSDVNLGIDYTIHILYKKDTTSDKMVIGHNSQSSLIGDWSDNNFYATSNSNAGISFSIGHIIDYSIMTLVRDGSSNQATLYENGLIHDAKTLGSSASISTTINLIGDRKFNDGKGDGNLADLTLYSAVKSISEVATLIQELNTKYSVFLPYGGAPTPPTISGTTLEHYLNPNYDVYSDMGKTAATNNNAVRATRTQQNDGDHIYQGTGANQMIYHDTILGTNGSLYKGGGDYMKMSKEITFTNSESFVAYSVHKRANNGANSIYFKLGVTKDSIIDYTNGTCYFFDSSGSASVNAGYSTDAVIRAYVIDRDADLFRVYDNGVEVGNKTIAARTGTVTFNAMFNWGSGTSLTGQIDHGDVLLYRGLHDATDVGTVSDWLNTKYSIY
tara:strand:+ start:357 stop:1871 length:1515 start_codon:yes stop_codon:yes gene_type:complete